ncbi:hypothetical protein CEUSTIGMA_g6841.t1 [Chlamydomonas eustigma]|uniref:J domain-containing protein n=1 Tax=Chlamydomonas eustigma TaxID=1157962 RepID=A0A250X9F5_9CHLO|nr:hypothetical protein CEUSTIGMA_g6841.t1 [Chlamydomonas eustigma]|eukprot:GAX79400.1 hypothetical protein CEUSTIGMA_g6841.t1 [Chlamydomonas eustigma]
MSDTCEELQLDQECSTELSELFECKLQMLSKTLLTVENNCFGLSSRLVSAEFESKNLSAKASEAETRASQLRMQRQGSMEIEKMLREEVVRLDKQLESERLRSAFSERKLQQQLNQEMLRADQLRLLRDNALAQRDDALNELASSYADMDALQATLSDSAVYVRYLRKKVLELELEQARNLARAALNQQDLGSSQSGEAESGAFNMASIKAAIHKAVHEAGTCPEDEKRRRIKQLQLRWHPDKNPVLAELATEITKLINEATAQLD